MNKNVTHIINSVIALLVSIVTIGGFFYTLDDRQAKASDVRYIEMRLDQKILTDRLYSIQRRIQELEDRYGGYENMPPSVKEEYRQLKQEYKIIEAQLRAIYDRMNSQ